MARRPDLGKQRLWLERIQRWRRSRLTARAFCGRYGLSEPSFHAWRRTLRERGMLNEAGDATSAPPADSAILRTPRFLAVEVAADAESSASGGCLEVVVGDAVVRVPARFDEAALAKLLTVLHGVRRRPC